MIDVIISKYAVLMECPYCLCQVKVGALVCKHCKATITQPSNADFRYCILAFLATAMIYAIIIKIIENISFLGFISEILRPLALILVPCFSLYLIRRKNKESHGLNTIRYRFTRY